MTIYKTCNKCGVIKEATAEFFYKHSNYKDGFCGTCKKCHNKYGRAYQKKNKDEIYKRQKIYREKNKEKRSKYQKEYHIKNKEKLNKQSREYYHKNKKKNLDYRKKYYQKNKKRISEQSLLYKYNLTLEEYNIMLKKQDGKCAICGQYEKSKSNNGEPKPLAIDHNHVTNKIRGLLCTNCNVGLGYFSENPLMLIKAVNYLKRHIT